MQSTYFLKSPIFITVRRDGPTREEAIISITCHSLPEGVDQDNLTPSAAAYRFCDRIRSEDYDPVELACELAQMDIEGGIRDAYIDAKWRAERFLRALKLRDADDSPQAAELDQDVPADRPLSDVALRCFEEDGA